MTFNRGLQRTPWTTSFEAWYTSLGFSSIAQMSGGESIWFICLLSWLRSCKRSQPNLGGIGTRDLPISQPNSAG
ncbi:MAG: hypothetical protein AAF282_22435 [Cyanobacteria bacterium P01_A01_bin.15]